MFKIVLPLLYSIASLLLAVSGIGHGPGLDIAFRISLPASMVIWISDWPGLLLLAFLLANLQYLAVGHVVDMLIARCIRKRRVKEFPDFARIASMI